MANIKEAEDLLLAGEIKKAIQALIGLDVAGAKILMIRFNLLYSDTLLLIEKNKTKPNANDNKRTV